MLKEEQKESKSDSQRKLVELDKIKTLQGFEFNTSAGFVCDINTGICGPVKTEKEGKE